MRHLRIGNSTCKLMGLTAPQFKVLRSILVYKERTGRWVRRRNKQGRMINAPEIKVHNLMDKAGGFPTGLLYIVQAWLDAEELGYLTTDTRITPQLNPVGLASLYVHKPYEPYPEQVEAALAAFEYGRGIIVGPTGVGKSTIAAEICEVFKVPTLIVVPKVELKKQLTESLRELFGESRVGPLVKGEAVYFITVENVDALKPDKVLKDIDCVIIDEFHHSGAKTYRVLNRKAWEHVYFKIGLTATPFRSRDEERLLLESVLSHVIYRIEYVTAVTKGYIVPLEAYYYTLPEKETQAKSYQGVYNALVVENECRNRLIVDLTAKLVEAGKSTLILTKQVNHGVLLQEMLLKRGIDVPFAEGKNGDLNKELINKFNRREVLGMIGTTGVIGEGVDTKPCEFVIIAGLGKSAVQFMQQCGRAFRRFGEKETGKVILFKDESHKWTLDHFEAQCAVLRREYSVEAVELELPSL
jgi:superfamily II DNA or RNA helicase